MRLGGALIAGGDRDQEKQKDKCMSCMRRQAIPDMCKCIVLHMHYDHFATDTDSVQVASGGVCKRHPGGTWTPPGRHQDTTWTPLGRRPDSHLTPPDRLPGGRLDAIEADLKMLIKPV